MPQDNQCFWDGDGEALLTGGCGDARSFRIFCISQSQRGCVDVLITWSRRGRGWEVRGVIYLASKWYKRQSVSVANETSMHWENSGPKQAAWTQNKSPHTHNHYSKPIYKHYLYFVPTLAHAHKHTLTHTHTELLVAESFSDSHRREWPFICIIENLFFPLRVQHTSGDELHNDRFCCWAANLTPPPPHPACHDSSEPTSAR